MALLFMDSFDHYVSGDLQQKWTEVNGGISAGNGRRSTASLSQSFLTATGKHFPNYTPGSALIVGVAFRPGQINGGPTAFLYLWDQITRRGHIILTIESDRSIGVYRINNTQGLLIYPFASDWTLLGKTDPGLLVSNGYAHVQLKAVIHDTAGSVEVRVNGSPTAAFAVTGVDTRNSSSSGVSAGANGLVLESGGDSSYAMGIQFDDLWVCDGSGPAPWNDFLGDCRVDCRYPNGAGAVTEWTPLTGSNWSNVDEPTPNGDTDYCLATASALTDLFTIQDAPVPGVPVYGVQTNISFRKADTGFCETAPVIRAGGTTYQGTPASLFTNYNYQTHVWPLNPSTGNPWTTVEFDALEVGYRRTQ